MALIFKVNSRDLTPYIQVAHDAGLDPSPADTIEPQFSGIEALGDGLSYVGDSVGNAKMVIPLSLKAATTDDLYALIRDIRKDLFKGAEIEYRSSQATNSTFFDLEQGKLDPDFEFWLDQAGRCRATLTLYRRPIGHTGTTRVLATAVATGPAVLSITATRAGDVDSLVDLSVGQPPPGGHRPFAYGFKTAPPSGWNPIFNASRIAQVAHGGSPFLSVKGASGCTGSGYLPLRPFLVGGTHTSFTYNLLNLPGDETYRGRHRVIIGARIIGSNDDDSKMYVTLLRLGKATRIQNRPIIPAEQNGARHLFQSYDMGEMSVPTDTGPIQLDLTYEGGASMQVAAGSSWFHLDSVSLIPLDECAGVQTSLPWLFYAVPTISAPTSGWNVDMSGVEKRSLLTTRSDFVYNEASISAGSAIQTLTDGLRGDFPKITPGASPVSLVVLPLAITGDPHATYGWGPAPLLGNVPVEISIAARERFSYLR